MCGLRSASRGHSDVAWRSSIPTRRLCGNGASQDGLISLDRAEQLFEAIHAHHGRIHCRSRIDCAFQPQRRERMLMSQRTRSRWVNFAGSIAGLVMNLCRDNAEYHAGPSVAGTSIQLPPTGHAWIRQMVEGIVKTFVRRVCSPPFLELKGCLVSQDSDRQWHSPRSYHFWWWSLCISSSKPSRGVTWMRLEQVCRTP